MRNFLLVPALFLAACGGAATNTDQAVPPTPGVVVTRTPAPRQEPDTELEQQFAQIAKDANGKVGIAAFVIETGQNASLNGNEKFAMQSVYKLPISMAVMKQVSEGKFKTDQQIEVKKEDFVSKGQASALRDKFPDGTSIALWQLIEYAISQSDGTASDVLMNLAGGAGEVQKYLGSIGVNDVAVKSSEKEMGKNWPLQYENFVTPNAAVSLLTELKAG